MIGESADTGGELAATTCPQIDSSAVIGPPTGIEPAAIYKLYRGTTGELDCFSPCLGRVWAEFPSVQLCWAVYDLPAREYDRASLFDLESCVCEAFTRGDKEMFRVSIYTQASPRPTLTMSPKTPTPRNTTLPSQVAAVPPSAGGAVNPTPPEASAQGAGDSVASAPPQATAQAPPAAEFRGTSSSRRVLAIVSESLALREFAEALQALLSSVQKEGHTGLEFIQKRLFQYLWAHQAGTKSEEEILEAQAVLAFNLDPKAGIAYLKEKLAKTTDQEVGEWLAQLSTEKGGLDPTMLGNYFSRKDTLEVFRAFVRCLDFVNTDIVVALRRLFDTFKPGGEGQVIERILDHFSEAYFSQWSRSQDVLNSTSSVTYADPDSICKAAFSLIMLNTELHVATKKVMRKGSNVMPMTVEEYIRHARSVLTAEEVPDVVLRDWYGEVREAEISIDPLPKADFSKLPVQPDIEGWMIVVFSAHSQRRYWAVLALQRIYFFSDESEVEPGDAIDLKVAEVRISAQDQPSKDRLSADLQPSKGCFCFAAKGFIDLADAEARAFEVVQQHVHHKPKLLKQLSVKPRWRLALLAESPELAEKWVNLISCGP